MTRFPEHGKSAPIHPIVSTSEPVCLVGGGEVGPRDLSDAKRYTSTFVAADSGAAILLDAGLEPDAVLGDFDSLCADTRARLRPETLHHIAEQDSTDFDKCLRNISAPLILGVGFLGARVDHQLGVFNRLVARPDLRCVVLGEHDIAFCAPPKLALSLPVGTRVSLFPMAPVRGRSRGLRWPIDGLGFAPDARTGTSNEASEDRVHLGFDAPGILVILPRDCLDAALTAVRSEVCGTWSARA